VLVWVAEDRLADDSRGAIEAATVVYVSAASVWEIEIKRALERLRAPDDIAARVDDSGYERLPITFEHATEAGRLPAHHSDPFDRMLIAQARLEGLILATADGRMQSYEVPVLQILPS
jgi:PIN domain nuclease of toxin-antitoxin system